MRTREEQKYAARRLYLNYQLILFNIGKLSNNLTIIEKVYIYKHRKK